MRLSLDRRQRDFDWTSLSKLPLPVRYPFVKRTQLLFPWSRPMTRRFWLRWCAWSVSCLAALGICRQVPADQQVANLNETLRSVLRARRPQEFAFVDLVTQKVDEGRLPTALVLSMMKWARERAEQRKSNIPFPYFQEGLRLRAAEIGVDLPAFSP